MQSVLCETVVLEADPEPDYEPQPIFFSILWKRWSGDTHLYASGDLAIFTYLQFSVIKCAKRPGQRPNWPGDPPEEYLDKSEITFQILS
jgi:hypothetical protein